MALLTWNQFLARPAAAAPQADVDRVRPLLESDERASLIGRGPWRGLLVPLILGAINAGCYAVVFVFLRDMMPGGGWLLAALATATTAIIFGVFWWILRGSLVVITNRRIILASGLGQLRPRWFVAADQIEFINERMVSVLGVPMPHFTLHRRDGSEKTLGTKEFTRTGSR